MRKISQISTAKESRTSPVGQPDCREFVIRARHGPEILFELRSRDPRDLLQVIWSRVKGIREIELTVEESRNGRHTTRDTVQLRRTPRLYDDLATISGRWLHGDFGAARDSCRK